MFLRLFYIKAEGEEYEVCLNILHKNKLEDYCIISNEKKHYGYKVSVEAFLNGNSLSNYVPIEIERELKNIRQDVINTAVNLCLDLAKISIEKIEEQCSTRTEFERFRNKCIALPERWFNASEFGDLKLYSNFLNKYSDYRLDWKETKFI